MRTRAGAGSTPPASSPSSGAGSRRCTRPGGCRRTARRSLTACVDAVEALLAPGALLLVSGSMPPGVPPEALGRIAALGRDRGARVPVDVAGAPMRKALRAGVFVARFNRPELEEFAGRALPDAGERHAAIADLVDEGRAEVAIATVGGDGALVAAPGLRSGCGRPWSSSGARSCRLLAANRPGGCEPSRCRVVGRGDARRRRALPASLGFRGRTAAGAGSRRAGARCHRCPRGPAATASPLRARPRRAASRPAARAPRSSRRRGARAGRRWRSRPGPR